MASTIRRVIPIPINGLDVSKPGEYIDSRATPDCQNITITRSTIEKRWGTGSLGDSLGERVLALAELERGGTTYFVRIGATEAETYNKTTGVWSSILAAPLTASDTDRVDVAYPQLSALRTMVWTNGVDAIKKFTGSGNAASLGGTPPICKYLIDYGGYLILAWVKDGGTDYYARVQWSDTGDPEEWVNGNAGSANLLDDGDEITGLGRFGEYITVHKATSIYVGYPVTSSQIFKFERKATGAGTICFATIQSLPTGEQIFLASDGLRLFNGITAPLIQSPITDEIREFLNPQYTGKCWSKLVREKDEYWCAMPIGGQTEPDTIYIYNYRTGQVYKDYRLNISACGDYKNTVGQLTWADKTNTWDSEISKWNDLVNLSLNNVVAFGGTTGTVSKRVSVSTDSGTAIESYWASKDYKSEDAGLDADTLVRWLGLQIWAKGQTLEVEYSTDAGSTWTLATTLTLTSNYPLDSTPQMVYFNTVSSMLRVRFKNHENNETFSLKKFVLMAMPREER
jgi:hypothetical protein